MRNTLHEPVDASRVPRFAGRTTFMRLPAVDSPEGLDVALVGIPWDGGTTNRAGARHGPREVRNQSSLMRRGHHVSGVIPYELISVADLGDIEVQPINLPEALRQIEAGIAAICAAGALPLSVGGDHLTTLPVLRAIHAHHGRERAQQLGLVQFDAHSDTNDTYFGDNRFTHGTPFRRAIEEGVLDPTRIVQIGIRGSVYASDEHQWAKDQGIRIIYIEEAVELGPQGVIAEVHRIIGDSPCYVTFDIDAIDPSMAPGTGTPEIGGFTTREAMAMVRGLAGLNILGADVVEVSPPFDLGGLTALTGATMLFELLCVIAAGTKRQGPG
ncbi:agmatinase [Xinfangfangia sp. D13-10-4-6]|uniref:agmatinase n=1 Tax=Pseudogemmobacter hezensis TaxID=2737662 RepID=UPI00155289B8|nr:agmatinase [Pseudogemmobacter hezensis]NPD14130.1 agmatinase [Pseudogemmobacter hezensis]